MKGIHLIAIVFLASWTVTVANSPFEKDDECPAEDDCPPKLLFHKDCTRFYECKEGQKRERQCPSGLRFSLRWRGCVKPENSECKDPECVDGELTKCEDDCTQFFVCEEGRKHLRQCPSGLHFSLRWRGCVKPELSECICTNGELIKYECNCTKYYYCIDNQKAERECPSGSHFNSETKTCEPGSSCEDSKALEPVCNDGESLPHECICEKYYLCIAGRKAVFDCAKNWHFDKKLKKCVQGKCDAPPPFCNNGETKEHDCAKTHGCELYYECIKENWIRQSCSNGQHFSRIEGKCMDSWEAGCKPGLCPRDSLPDGRWSHECDCRLYYQCVNGEKQLDYCKWGDYYNENSQTCESAKKVNCKNYWDDWV